MKISAELDSFEAETLFDVLHQEIIKHTAEAKLQFLSKEISKSHLEWHLSHAEYLEGIKKKLLGKT